MTPNGRYHEANGNERDAPYIALAATTSPDIETGTICIVSEKDHSGEESWQNQEMRFLDNLERYEITYPEWLHSARHRRSNDGIKHPSVAEVKISAAERELVLQLQRNDDLFSPKYEETWYSPNGARQRSTRDTRANCFYHGTVRGMEGSHVVVSTCAGLRGLITLKGNESYMIEPLPDHIDPEGHAVYRASDLEPQRGSCGNRHDVQNQTERLQELLAGMMQPHSISRERLEVSENMMYVELLMVADHALYVKHGRDVEKTKMKLLEAANYVDKYYKALNIRVALIGLEIWTDQDKISVSDNPYSTLGAFLTWRGKQLSRLPNDNAQLITGMSFHGTTIGLAPLKAMCSEYQSGGVNSDHSENAVGVAATMAHEMGHNFGMSHDSAGCCQAQPEDGGCIMAAATGHPFPRVFNPCNQKELKRYLSSGGGKCLFNPPNTKAMYGGQRCGNGYLEEGEECDCGDVEECSSPCCNANNCTLKVGAECAHGVCCDNCKLKSPGVMCRPPSGSCDLPEYCDGKSEFCPANFYLMDGSSCARGKAYCYTGMCLTLEQQCLSLWGKDAQPAPDVCFTKVNEAGDPFGNCGKDLMGKYRACTEKDAKCGKIQCLSKSSKPIEFNAVAIDTTIHLGSRKIMCRGTHVYRQGQGEDGQGDTLDPGLVMTGTKCGENGICFGGECRNASFLRADECGAKCHGRGLCNNNHNCHCDVGWAPPHCLEAGAGGSLDSGPVTTQISILPVLVLLPLFCILGLVILGLWCYYKHRRHSLKAPASSAPQICVSIPAPPNTKAPSSGHANPTFQLKRPDTGKMASPRPSPGGPTRSRHSIVRPTVKPPPIPAYAVHQQDMQLKDAGPKLQPSPSVASKSRPEPPDRPPPPCPISKPTTMKEELTSKNRLQVSPRGRTNWIPPQRVR
ncbi:disintegrin and metalloproteinase domain-containing protein 19 [Chanos chanos]|uniref:Disintegrin and metalloproteinase domain-containing protein 19 n=1 Tax=Chanos chanos TaxID=29144 RepID=A0A6J2UM56_CHACN|nr:disintegrin and metalloproteinase domain-containing protein 19 [Chanos chanos]